MNTTFVEPSPALPLVHLAIAVRGGAALDPSGREGLTRLTARMLRRGVRGMSSHEVEDAIDRLGADFGAETSAGSTTVYGSVIRRSLEPFVDLVARLLAEPTFDGVELGRLKREAEAELVEARDSDRTLVTRGLRRTLFAGHPYGARAAGTIAGIRAVAREDVLDHHRHVFSRRAASVAISGDVDHETGGRIAERLLAALPDGERDAPPRRPPSRRAAATSCSSTSPSARRRRC